LASEFVVKRHQHGPKKKNPIRAWNRAIAGNLHISGVLAPFQTREARAFPPKPSANRHRLPRSAAMGCLSRRQAESELHLQSYAPGKNLAIGVTLPWQSVSVIQVVKLALEYLCANCAQIGAI
jgi:hypothetical protein